MRKFLTNDSFSLLFKCIAFAANIFDGNVEFVFEFVDSDAKGDVAWVVHYGEEGIF